MEKVQKIVDEGKIVVSEASLAVARMVARGIPIRTSLVSVVPVVWNATGVNEPGKIGIPLVMGNPKEVLRQLEAQALADTTFLSAAVAASTGVAIERGLAAFMDKHPSTEGLYYQIATALSFLGVYTAGAEFVVTNAARALGEKKTAVFPIARVAFLEELARKSREVVRLIGQPIVKGWFLNLLKILVDREVEDRDKAWITAEADQLRYGDPKLDTYVSGFLTTVSMTVSHRLTNYIFHGLDFQSVAGGPIEMEGVLCLLYDDADALKSMEAVALSMADVMLKIENKDVQKALEATEGVNLRMIDREAFERAMESLQNQPATPIGMAALVTTALAAELEARKVINFAL